VFILFLAAVSVFLFSVSFTLVECFSAVCFLYSQIVQNVLKQGKYAKCLFNSIHSLHRKKYFSFWMLNVFHLEFNYTFYRNRQWVWSPFSWITAWTSLFSWQMSDRMLFYDKRKQRNFSLFLHQLWWLKRLFRALYTNCVSSFQTW
jgi:hypothetical protein